MGAAVRPRNMPSISNQQQDIWTYDRQWRAYFDEALDAIEGMCEQYGWTVELSNLSRFDSKYYTVSPMNKSSRRRKLKLRFSTHPPSHRYVDFSFHRGKEFLQDELDAVRELLR